MSEPLTISTLSGTDYATRRRKLLDLIKQLRAIGAQADLDLPRIVVIGNQSAGKSSLVEAISGINVPRDAGTCTRCPMECRLASSDTAWSCQVYIRWEFDTLAGKRKDEVQEIPFGPLITQKAHVELALRRAQCAVLNPKIDPAHFEEMTVEDIRGVTNALAFSQNTVCMDLSGPELTDLAFVDLPGIIQNADPETVYMVENMVVNHIQGNCLILLTIPMSDDIENQKAARLAKQVDPSGQRTIGVLTKPDTLTVGAVKSKENWLAVLEGHRFKTAHGYFCTRQPDDDERARGITAAEARAAERAFFGSTAPWSTSQQRHRFGTEVLVDNLSRLLSKVIDESLPKLQSELTGQLSSCTAEYAALPPAITSDPSSFVLNLVLDLCRLVQQYVEGDVSAAALVQQNRRTYAVFKRDIQNSSPLFMPYITAAEVPSQEERRFFRFDEEERDTVLDLDTDANENGSRVSNVTLPPNEIYLSDLRNHIRNALTRELPDNIPYAVKSMLIRQSQQGWAELCNKCYMAVRATFDKTLRIMIRQKFHRFDHLHARVSKILTDLANKQAGIMENRVGVALEVERVPYTQNTHYLQNTKAKYLALYKDARAGKLELPEAELKPTDPRLVPGYDNVKASLPLPSVHTATNPAPFSYAKPKGASDFSFGKPTTPGAFVNLATSPTGFGGTPVKEKTKGEDQPVVNPFSVFGSHTTPTSAEKIQGFPTPVATTTKSLAIEQPREKAIRPAVLSRKTALDSEERRKLENNALAALASLGYHVTPADLGKLNPPDLYEAELELMAEVRAYFQVAYKRIIDQIPMTIDHSFLFGFAGSLQECLIEELGLGTPQAAQRCAAYLAEDHRIVSIREELGAKKKRLESVQMELLNFGL